MKKILIVFLCFLAGGLVYWAWPEYGSGYSEEQRRRWNERRALCPAAWGLELASRFLLSPWRYEEHLSYMAAISGRDLKTIKSEEKEKKAAETELVKQLEANRDRSGPDCLMREPLPEDTSRLPLYGLTEKEVAARALAGDGDACLLMVQNRVSDPVNVFGGLSWRNRHEAGKWLDRAIAAKRPGAGFLKGLMGDYLIMQKSSMRSDGVFVLGKNLEWKKVPDYVDFVECLRKGDYIVCKTALSLSGMSPSEYLLEETKVIYDALLKGAREGNVDCQRDFALLVLGDGRFSSCIQRVWGDVKDKQENWEKMLKWLPSSWREGGIKGLFFCGIIDADRTPFMKDYREASEYARRAARQGDLTGMYLWMRHGITSMERFTVEDWNDILFYGRTLFEAGYIPYMKKIRERAEKCLEVEFLDDTILRSYYSKKSYQALENRDYFEKRGDIYNFSGKDELETIRKKLQDCCLTGRTDVFLKDTLTGKDFSDGGLMRESSEEVRRYLLEQVEKWAVEGDIHAMYALAGIYEKGIGVPANLERAYVLYRKVFDEASGYPLFRVLIRDGEGHRNSYKGIHLKQATALKLGYMMLNHADFPGRNEKEVCDFVFEVSGGYSNHEHFCYVLGQFHERGIGRPADREAALNFYKKGSSDNRDCRLAVDRLTAPEEEKKTERK